MQRWMHQTAHMPELREYAAARRMNRVGHSPPVIHLFGTPEAAGIRPAAALQTDMSRLRQDQSGGCALRIIGRHEVRRHMVSSGAAARQRRHPNAVRAGEAADGDGIKKSGHEILYELRLPVSRRGYTTGRLAILSKL